MNARILIVEDEARIAEPLADALRARGFDADVAPDGATGTNLAGDADLVLLDLNLGDTDGLDVCRAIRARNDIPIIILSARSDIGDRVAGLELGADDFVPKPFELAELVARIRAHLRRHSRGDAGDAERPAVLEIGAIRLDPSSRRVWRSDDELELSPKEFDLLELLMANAGSVVRREQAIDEVWDPHWHGSTKTLDVHIRWIRQKIEDDPSAPIYITTVRGVGFRFTDPAEVGS